MTLSKKAQIDNYIMKLLKIEDIAHSVAETSKGRLSLRLRKGETENDYRFVLDSVPVDDVTNRELKELYKGVLFD